MTLYKHTQVGWIIILLVGATAILVMALGFTVEWNPVAAVVAAILIVIAALFATLTTEIKDGALECRFGPGLVRRRFLLSEIQEAREVRNHWYYGWGIRITPHGMLFNVSGLDAVEIILMGGGRFRIGTDRPSELADAIRQNAGLRISSAPID